MVVGAAATSERPYAMTPTSLNEDEFRLLAYVRAYADGPAQHLDPTWVQEQLAFSLAQMQEAARGLADKGLAEFFEFDPPADVLAKHPEITPGPHPCDIHLTAQGWHFLRRDQKAQPAPSDP